ncbi:hypothetical protein SBA2_270096 [Acidobacteriia bacterium SbA2]|nr:hypothetical protein SBA2_270096 [Acidobacteriia bacterium SbA2]
MGYTLPPALRAQFFSEVLTHDTKELSTDTSQKVTSV